MHPVIAKAPNGRPHPGFADSYAVTAEFYDVLQADRDEARVHHLYGRQVARARVGVLDIGAGTGRVTLMSLARSRVDVHAVEPARAMRTSLMTRLAALPARQRERVTVHSHALDEAPLSAVADVAVCHNTVACLPPAAREVLWPAIGKALVPGGSLFLQMPPALVPVRDVLRLLPEKRVGEHVYGGRLTMSAAGNRIRTRADYWVRGAQGVLREHTETFWMWPASRARIIDDLARHAFAPLPGQHDPGVLAVTLQPDR
ncbi:bifunctional 2-polyprenyl-6-hydroxyphenol methylase/3-demethylubiquinol 3-O-methyltransferase UbiG [Streptomyces sp. TLI_185]|uniref:class I SAM-dependent methyltransferase n=1 Tax=Streptomyces sp. TLI_185 TaxID=2485151 RepID=UPI000F5067A3|nr:class I SAM-dependent methyltransferase [Streptomyces sp. TLI_185]RPF30461.1 methyltransferase family protein [Streptomyces sp. TLI_185]